jgi:membrane protein YqaA with SNARE-associated domain
VEDKSVDAVRRRTTLIRSLLRVLIWLGGFGLIGLGILDSSFLFLPLANDLLLVALTARKPDLFWYYAIMATTGSVIGCFLTDLLSRRLGEAGIERMANPRRLETVQRRLKTHAWWVLGTAALMPPPFPFTVFLMAAAALQIPRTRVLTAVAAARLVRYFVVALLAVRFGSYVLRLAQRDAVQYFIIGLAVISIGGSALSIVKWVRSSRRPANARSRDLARPESAT